MKKDKKKREEISNTFKTVDDKLAEAEFFLRNMAECGQDLFEFKCYFSAFLSSSRTSTLTLQHFFHLPEFGDWYKGQQAQLRAAPLARIFLDIRNDHVHGGPYPITSSEFYMGKARHYFHRSILRKHGEYDDVFSLSLGYFLILLEVVFDCYSKLGVHIDPQQYFTKEHFATLGWDIDDAEIDVYGWICTSLIEEGLDVDARWTELRTNVGKCEINHLFYSYLGKVTPLPVIREEYLDFEFNAEDRGWIHIPAGFSSLEEYAIYFGRRFKKELVYKEAWDLYPEGVT